MEWVNNINSKVTKEVEKLKEECEVIEFKCGNCNKTKDELQKFNKKLKACGRCKEIKYCSIKCQKNAWETHKIVCKDINTIIDNLKSMFSDVPKEQVIIKNYIDSE
jgi:hypothetical protein